jgi:hypothetical protein
MHAPPKPVWQWPPAIMSLRDLLGAMRQRFELYRAYTDRGTVIYCLALDGEAAPVGVLEQVVAHRAYTHGDITPTGETRPGDQFKGWPAGDVKTRLTWERLVLKPKAHGRE